MVAKAQAGEQRRRQDPHQRRPDKPVTAPAGDTLLNTLAAQDLHPLRLRRQGHLRRLQGHVHEGGGDRCCPPRGPHQPRRGARGLRLSCQVKVKQDMKIEVPEPEIFGVKKWSARCAQRQRGHLHQGARAQLPAGETVPFRAGGYIQIECPPHTVHLQGLRHRPEYHGDWDKFKLWRYVSKVDEPVTRAYSMANYPPRSNIIMLNVRIASPPPRMPDVPPGNVVLHLQPEARRQGDHLGPLRRVLRQGHRQRDGVHRRRRRHGPDALAHLRPVPPPHPPQGHASGTAPAPARGLLLSTTSTRSRRRTRTSSGTSRCPSRCPRTTGPA
jgi:hypothetical protein